MQDWLDIDFGLAEGADFIAVSFVKSADVMTNLKSYVSSRSDRPVEVIAKIESFDSVPNAQEIVEASDGVMVARGDLGASPQRSHRLSGFLLQPPYIMSYLCENNARSSLQSTTYEASLTSIYCIISTRFRTPHSCALPSMDGMSK